MADLISGLVFIVISGGVFGYALQLPAARGNVPGPGFFPELAAILGIVVGAAICVRAVIAMRVTGGAPRPARPEAPADLLRFAGVLAVSTGYLLALRPLGFALASALLLLVVLVILGERRIFILLAVPAALTAVVLLIFTSLLGLRLPAGTIF